MNRQRALPTLLATLLFAACAPAVATHPVASAPAPTPVSPAPARLAQLPNDVHWARNSAEHDALYVEIYRAAGERLATLAAGRAPRTWGVILDADETMIDNSEYEKSRAPYGGSFDANAWNAWIAQGRAPALPGAADFANRVHALGGRVVIVTNRADQFCDATRANFTRVGIHADLVLCQTSTGDKNPRFDAVQNGTAAAGFPAITVLEWLGDNIQDFPHLTQDVRTGGTGAYAKFGDTYFALPNPMYGSWEKNARQ